MADPWCDRCDLPLDQCEHSLPKERRDPFGARRHAVAADLVADGPTISATQKSPCVGCGALIEEGDSITYTEDGWAHSSEVLSKPVTDPETFRDVI